MSTCLNFRFVLFLCLSSLASISQATVFDDIRAAVFSSQYEYALSLLNTQEKNSAEGLYYKALILSSRSYKAFNIKQAITYFKESAQQGYRESAIELEKIYFDFADELDPSYLSSIAWSKEKDRLLFTDTSLPRFQLIETSEGMKRLSASELLELQIKKSSEEPFLQLHVAQSYEYGLGTAPNKEKAMQWYLKSAKSGSQTAISYIGYEYCLKAQNTSEINQANYWLRRFNKHAYCPSK